MSEHTLTDDSFYALRNAIYEASVATTDVRSFASHSITVDEGLAAAKRLTDAAVAINQIVQGAYNASP